MFEFDFESKGGRVVACRVLWRDDVSFVLMFWVDGCACFLLWDPFFFCSFISFFFIRFHNIKAIVPRRRHGTMEFVSLHRLCPRQNESG